MVAHTRRNFPKPLPLGDIYIRGKTLSIWLPAETYNRVLAQAEEESRSLSNMIEVLCRRGLIETQRVKPE